MDNKDFDTISEDTAQGFLDAFKGMNDALKGFEDTWQRNYGVLVDKIKLKYAEKTYVLYRQIRTGNIHHPMVLETQDGKIY